MRVFTHRNEISDAWRHASQHPQIIRSVYAIVSVQKADTLMMEASHQQHDLITFSNTSKG